MDYRKLVVFGENWSASRYKVLPYFAVEKAIMTRPGAAPKILDLGCAAGWNMSRFRQYGRSSFGLDVVPERVQLALHHGPVVLGSGLQLPFADESLDIVYVQHVLHHIGDVTQAVAEVRRCLKPGGTFFVIETAEDSPIIRWGRRLYPHWMGDEITAHFDFAGLQQALKDGGFHLTHAQQYSVLFWIWEILPDQIGFMEKLTPLFVALEGLAVRFWRQKSAHCFVVGTKDGA